jgi:hypothetical protein
MTLKDRLVADWREISGYWSVRWAAAGALLLPLLQVLPNVMPVQIAALLPTNARAMVDALWCVGFIVLRAWSQKKA